MLNEDGTRAEWPRADVVVGNPPFLGNKKMIAGLGEDYTVALRKACGICAGRRRRVAHLVRQGLGLIQSGNLARVGLVTTKNGIRSGATSEVLKPIVQNGRIFCAWSDEIWTVNGAAVRVSMVCFDGEKGQPAKLNGSDVGGSFSDLTAQNNGLDLSAATRLQESAGVSFQGVSKVGSFEIPGALARDWLQAPTNPNGKLNKEVLRPWVTGTDLTTGNCDEWVIDFGLNMLEVEAQLFELPFHAVATFVFPARQKSRRDAYRIKAGTFTPGTTGNEERHRWI